MKIIKKTIATTAEKECLQDAARILDSYCGQQENCESCYFFELCKDSNYDLPQTLGKFAYHEIELEY